MRACVTHMTQINLHAHLFTKEQQVVFTHRDQDVCTAFETRGPMIIHWPFEFFHIDLARVCMDCIVSIYSSSIASDLAFLSRFFGFGFTALLAFPLAFGLGEAVAGLPGFSARGGGAAHFRFLSTKPIACTCQPYIFH